MSLFTNTINYTKSAIVTAFALCAAAMASFAQRPSMLPTRTLLIEKDTVIYANESITTLTAGDTANWVCVPQHYLKDKTYSSEDMGVTQGKRKCEGVAAGGTKTKIYPYSTSSILHMNVSNVRTARVYMVIDNNYRGARIHANKVSEITSETQDLTQSGRTEETQITSNSTNKEMDFVLDMKELDPKDNYILTVRGYGTASSYSYLYAVKLYAANTPTLRLESGDVKTIVTARNAMEPIVIKWTNPNGNTKVPTINWTSGSQPEWMSVVMDGSKKTITISGTPENNSYETADTLKYEISIDGGNTINCSLKVDKHDDPAPLFSTKELNHSYLPGEEANFAISYSYAKSVSVTGLPEGFYYKDNNGTVTITGLMGEQSEYPKVYNYTITPTPLDDYNGEIIPYHGTITAISPTAPRVAFVYTNDNIDELDAIGKVYNVVNTNYNVTAIPSEEIGEYDTEILAPYDLIVLHESANSSSSGALNVGTWIGYKPVLNTKAHMYGKDNWPMMGANVTDEGDGYASISDIHRNHIIFNGIDTEYGTIDISGNIRGVYLPGKKESVIYSIASNSAGNTSIIEENNGSTGSNKYLMVAIGSDNPEKAIEENLTTDGRKLIKNACDYLLNNNELWTTTERSKEAEIKSLTLNGATGVFDGEYIYVRLLADTTETSEITQVIPNIVISDNATITNDGVAMDFSNEKEVHYTVTSEDHNYTTTYTVVVELIDAALETPYLDSIGVGLEYYKPEAIYSSNGTLTYMPAYAKEDAALWTQSGEAEGTASVLRISANASLTIMVKDPSTVTVGMSSTGGREFKAYIDGTMISTTKVKSLAKAEINVDVNLPGVHFITIDNIGTGTSVIGFIKITSMNITTETATETTESDNDKEVISTEYYTFDGKKIGSNTMTETPVIRITRFSNGSISVDKVQKTK